MILFPDSSKTWDYSRGMSIQIRNEYISNIPIQPCLIEEYFKQPDPFNLRGPCIISCPCPKCRLSC